MSNKKKLCGNSFYPDMKQTGDSLNQSSLDIFSMHNLNKIIMMARHLNKFILIIFPKNGAV